MKYTSKEQRIAKLKELVEHFKFNLQDYKNKNYKEAKVRTDFLDPFFEIFDWDVRNESRKSEDYRDVITEDSLEVQGSKRAPDYCFKIGKERKFYVEAKKPSVDIQQETEPALQVRRYGYTAGLPVSILTDFQKFAVYDTTKRPHKSDKASTGRIRILDFTEYVDNFDYLYDTFSKTAIERGSFDKYAADKKNKRGTESIDKGLLALVEELRKVLAKNIAKNNNLDIHSLNDAVIKIIDRIIFLRIAEDKAVEPYESLLRAADSVHAYNKIKEIFKEANERYNSELFKPNKTIDGLVIDDKIFKEILTGLYYPECPYEFSVLPVSILGNIYEQFLGQTIRFTDSGLVKIEEKPEVRKAGGVYYTPEYIVDYIVKNTVGEKIQGLTPEKIEKIKVLDPACGSGSFLIGAYQYLLDYHLAYYTTDDKHIKKALKEERIAANLKGGYRLTIPEKQNILKNNIFGVDIDAQAVEVSKFSLLIKLMETETEQTTSELFNISKVEGRKDARILPNLEANIKCGNSLIGKDFLKDNLFVDNEELIKINPFDWGGCEGFPEIMRGGGFDCIVGNPPYIFTRDDGFSQSEKVYLQDKFKDQNKQLNTYALFVRKFTEELKNSGRFGFIIPNNWLTIPSMKNFRDYIISNTKSLAIINNMYKVFDGANVDTSILTFTKGHPIDVLLSLQKQPEVFENIVIHKYDFLLNSATITFNADTRIIGLLQKIENNSLVLNSVAKVSTGLKCYQIGKGIPVQTEKIKENRAFHADCKKDASYGKYLQGADVKRYLLNWSGEFLKYGDWLAEPRRSVPFAGERILVRQIPSKPPYMINAAYTDAPFYNDINSMVVFAPQSDISLLNIAAVLNSRIISFWFANKFEKMQRNIFPQFKVNELAAFPIPKNLSSDRHAAAELSSLAKKMLEMQHYLQTAKTEIDKKIYQQKADIIDKRIDALVCELYGLTPEEIKIIEGK